MNKLLNRTLSPNDHWYFSSIGVVVDNQHKMVETYYSTTITQ